jgi:anti-sigma regulatory factor (Ser/Thr protein kinase)
MTHQWPLHSFLELGALPGAVPCARLHARQLLWEWGLAALTDRTELVVSELVTNAIQASRITGQASSVWLWLLSDKAQVLVLVWDASPRSPVRADVNDDTENGRGLLLVEAVSEKWACTAQRMKRAASTCGRRSPMADDGRKRVAPAAFIRAAVADAGARFLCGGYEHS